MFDDRLEGALGDFDALLHLTGDNQAEEKRIGCRKLRLAAAWADAHGAPEDRDTADNGPSGVLVERFVRMGAVGTPLVAETCPAEWALPQHTSPAGARAIIADALTLRHRHPRLWQQILAGKVFAWKARQVGQRCSGLNVLSARIVDRLVTDQLELMAWTRFEKILDATLLQVDETTYQQRAAQAAAQRDVCATQSSAGLRTLIARVTAGDATMFLALVNRVAECLADDGDEDPIGVRRSKAIGIVANPGRLLDLLTRHVGDTDPHRTPDQQVSDHVGDPTDPWAADPPPAGWDTDRHGAYHQPRFPHDPDHP
ncbi:MAG: HNH endonuclease, partial [Microlunatus sp.]|nr:HNH endonuclease [Microlunatus sp.]